jgi:hypothetical protein
MVVPVEGAVVTVGTVVATVGGTVGTVVTAGVVGAVVGGGTVVGVVGGVVVVWLGVVVPVVGCETPPVRVPVLPVSLAVGITLLPPPVTNPVAGSVTGGTVTDVAGVVSLGGGSVVVTPNGPVITVGGVVGVERATPGLACFEPRLSAKASPPRPSTTRTAAAMITPR